MIDVSLVESLGGPVSFVLTPPEARNRWLKNKWVLKGHNHTEGTLLTLTTAGETVAKTTLALKNALALHPELLEAPTNPTYGQRDPGAGHSIPRAQEHKRRAA